MTALDMSCADSLTLKRWIKSTSLKEKSKTNSCCFVDQNEKVENIKMSVEKAKEAVQCDVKDGTSWCKWITTCTWLDIKFWSGLHISTSQVPWAKV